TGNDPGPLGRTDPQIAGDGRQRNIGDRDIEHAHESGQRYRQGAGQPLPAFDRLIRQAGGSGLQGFGRGAHGWWSAAISVGRGSVVALSAPGSPADARCASITRRTASSAPCSNASKTSVLQAWG